MAKRNLSRDLTGIREVQAKQRLAVRVKALSYMVLVNGVEVYGGRETVYINVKLSWLSVLFCGLLDIFIRLRTYYALDNDDELERRCVIITTRSTK